MVINLIFDLTQCYLFEKTGIPCITCGFTRAAKSLSKGNLIESIQYNAGFIPFATTLLLIFLSIILKNEKIKKTIPIFVYSTLIILFLHWIIKLSNFL